MASRHRASRKEIVMRTTVTAAAQLPHTAGVS
jgi:hypothetical protein